MAISSARCFLLIPLLLLVIGIATLSIVIPFFSSGGTSSYTDHCSATVAESTLSDWLPWWRPSASSFLTTGYFSGGDQILFPDHDPSSTSNPSTQFGSFGITPHTLRRTRTRGTFYLQAALSFRGERHQVTHLRGSYSSQRKAVFELSGFWSESSGKLCMVGTGSVRSKSGTPLWLSAVFKFNYPNVSTIFTSLLTGKIESLHMPNTSSYYNPISVVAYKNNHYSYTQLTNSCSSHPSVGEETFTFNSSTSCSSLLPYLNYNSFNFDYGSNCSNNGGPGCGPLGESLGSNPEYMTFSQIQCSEDGRFSMYMTFPRTNTFWGDSTLVPDSYLVGEGIWDQKEQQLCLTACQTHNASVGDCTIGLSVWLPSVFSINTRSTAAGLIWSKRDKSDPAYFKQVSFKGSTYNVDTVHRPKYNYTAVEAASNSCSKKTSAPNSGQRRYPDARSIRDMDFNANARSGKKHIWVTASPLFIGETFYPDSYTAPESTSPIVEANLTTWNVSYTLNLHSFSEDHGLKQIYAEGTYDSKTGCLSMVGCGQNYSASVDCKIQINVQLAPLNTEEGELLSGAISTAREPSDPLYFAPLNFSAHKMYTAEAADSIWRMDMEIVMLLISLTLSCIFIAFQIFHVKRNPDLLPFVSITMLVVLTLGNMIPLVLNFEAFSPMNDRRGNRLSWNGGWLDVYEVVVRVMIMMAFLLQLRLLQLAWCARSTEESRNGIWVRERKALKLCLTLYVAGGFIAWFVNRRDQTNQMQWPKSFMDNAQYHWWYLKSYCGLILDSFLLPQVVLNIIRNSKGKAIALKPIFYIGITVVRGMPHLYDAYRASHYFPHLESSYIYAHRGQEFYSSAWDIIVPCEGLLFVVIIYLQQRLGGGCIISPRSRKAGGYERVPAVVIV